MFFREAEQRNKKRNHRVYIGPGADGSTDDKIAVDLKYDPKNTKITFRSSWKEEGYCKSTWVLYGREWQLLEECEALGHIEYFEEGMVPDKLITFIHPSQDEDALRPTFNHFSARLTVREFEQIDGTNNEDAKACYLNLSLDDPDGKYFVPDPAEAKTVTLNKRQKKTIAEGYDRVRKQETAMWATLKAVIPSTRKILLMCTVYGSLFTPAIGHMTSFIDPGYDANQCPAGWEKQFEKAVDDIDPTLTYVHVPWHDDVLYDEEKVKRVHDTVDQLIDKGKTVIVADTLNTSRWDACGMEPVRCRGDLAFYCNDDGIAQQLKDWAHEKEGGVPRCV